MSIEKYHYIMCKDYLRILPPTSKIAFPEVSLQSNRFLLIKSFRRFMSSSIGNNCGLMSFVVERVVMA